MTNYKKDSKDEPLLKNLGDVKEEVIEHEQEISQLQKQVKQVKKQVSQDDDDQQGGLAEGEINKTAPPVNPGAVQKLKSKKGKARGEDEDKQILEEGDVNPSAPPAGWQ